MGDTSSPEHVASPPQMNQGSPQSIPGALPKVPPVPPLLPVPPRPQVGPCLYKDIRLQTTGPPRSSPTSPIGELPRVEPPPGLPQPPPGKKARALPVHGDTPEPSPASFQGISPIKGHFVPRFTGDPDDASSDESLMGPGPLGVFSVHPEDSESVRAD